MAKEARELVQRGALGTILKVVAQYPQGWLLRPIDAEGQKQAVWRTNPEQAGASACVADIGTHAENLARYITSLRIEELCADFTTFVEGRRLEDDASLLLRYKEGARGVLCASQILAGEENDFNIRVYGTKASLEWHQESPDHLIVKYPDAPRQVLRRGSAYVSDAARRATRLPPGGPEAFIEAFANIYREAARAIRAEVNGDLTPEDLDFPTVDDGLEGMAFITAWRLLPRRFRAQKPEASGQKCPPPPKNVLTGEQFKTGARKDLLVGRPVTRMASFQLGGRVFLFGRTFCAIFSLFVLISRIAGSRCQATAMRRMSRTSELPQKRPSLFLGLRSQNNLVTDYLANDTWCFTVCANADNSLRFGPRP